MVLATSSGSNLGVCFARFKGRSQGWVYTFCFSSIGPHLFNCSSSWPAKFAAVSNLCSTWTLLSAYSPTACHSQLRCDWLYSWIRRIYIPFSAKSGMEQYFSSEVYDLQLRSAKSRQHISPRCGYDCNSPGTTEPSRLDGCRQPGVRPCRKHSVAPGFLASFPVDLAPNFFTCTSPLVPMIVNGLDGISEGEPSLTSVKYGRIESLARHNWICHFPRTSPCVAPCK